MSILCSGWRVVLGAIGLLVTGSGGAVASADPPILPFVPGIPNMPYQGAYTYEIGTGAFAYPPHATDTRGVRTSAVTADPTQTNVGLPASKPGAASPNQSYWINFANQRYGNQGGIVPPDTGQALTQSANGTLPGVVSSAGAWPEPLLESPTGTPSRNGTLSGEVENSAPPSYPQLEPPSVPPPPANSR